MALAGKAPYHVRIMDEQALRQLLDKIRSGEQSVDQGIKALKHLPFEDIGFAKVDHHRSIRCGFPEVIYCEGKQTAQVVEIVKRRLAGGGNILASRASAEVAKAVKQEFPEAQYNTIARTITIRQRKLPKKPPHFVAIVCAGTSDMSVAEEARETCEIMDEPTRSFYDIGVAGIHRLLAHSAELTEAKAIVVCAGMEGALASVVGGLVSSPVIAVPTSIGYGASFNGIAPLLTMLNSCAAGVSVVNIDNGFGAGYMAALIARTAQPPAPAEPVQPASQKKPGKKKTGTPKKKTRKTSKKKQLKKTRSTPRSSNR
jgi:hypothetical protein